MAIDKIGYRVYNVIRNPQGAYISILRVNIQLPPRVFQGILSEYLALKCSPIVVYMDFGYFLVMLYILGIHPRVALALPSVWQVSIK